MVVIAFLCGVCRAHPHVGTQNEQGQASLPGRRTVVSTLGESTLE
jgi:hypothetical protein